MPGLRKKHLKKYGSAEGLYVTKISAENLVKIYEALGREATGKWP